MRRRRPAARGRAAAQAGIVDSGRWCDRSRWAPAASGSSSTIRPCRASLPRSVARRLGSSMPKPTFDVPSPASNRQA